MKDLYDILGVSRQADGDDIKKRTDVNRNKHIQIRVGIPKNSKKLQKLIVSYQMLIKEITMTKQGRRNLNKLVKKLSVSLCKS